MKWASAVAEDEDLELAFDRASSSVSDDLEGRSPDLLFAFVSADFADRFRDVPGLVGERFPEPLLAGCSAGGVVGGGREVERRPAVSVTAAVLPRVDLRPFHIGAGDAEGLLHRPSLWYELLDVEADDRLSIVLLPDPFTSDAQSLIRSLDLAFPDSDKIGGMASGGRSPGENALFLDDQVLGMGAVGVALRGPVRMETIVAQGCRPIGSPMFVTRGERNRVYELDGTEVVDVLRELYGSLDEDDQELFQHSLFLGMVMDEEQEEYGQGDFLIRNITGLDADEGVLAVGARIEAGQVVQFHLRDARTSAEDLDALLRRYVENGPDRRPDGVLLFSCLGRGEHLYGEPDHDSRLIAERAGPGAIGGFFCNGEIGPVRGRSFLHGYTSSIGLFHAEGED